MLLSWPRAVRLAPAARQRPLLAESPGRIRHRPNRTLRESRLRPRLLRDAAATVDTNSWARSQRTMAARSHLLVRAACRVHEAHGTDAVGRCRVQATHCAG